MISSNIMIKEALPLILPLPFHVEAWGLLEEGRVGDVESGWLSLPQRVERTGQGMGKCAMQCRLYHTIPALYNTMQYNKLLLSRVLNQPFNLWQIKRRGVHNMKNVPIKKGRD